MSTKLRRLLHQTKQRHALFKVVEELLDAVSECDPIRRHALRMEFRRVLSSCEAFNGRCETCGRELHHQASISKRKGPVCSGLGSKHYTN